jgi:mannose-6-phosphate isomerase-like protein (cupin superfamily)
VAVAAIKILVRGDESEGRVGIVESVMPAGAAGPPLHVHDFDEAFVVVDGELTFQLGDRLLTARAGELVFAPGAMPHTVANLSSHPARYILVCTPAGFEREFARRAARSAGTEPPAWAMQPVPEVRYVGPRIGERKEPHVQDVPRTDSA